MRSLSRLCLAVCCAGVMVSCQQGGVTPVDRAEVTNENNHDVRFGYAVGYNVAKQLLRDSVPLDVSAILAGMQDGISDNTTLTEEEMVGVLRRHDSLRQVAFMENVKAQSKAFLDEYRAQEGVTETASGLMYKVVERGEGGQSPEAGGQAVVYYKGTLADGTVFDQTQPGNPATFPVGGLIPGFNEGLSLMKTGDKFEFCIPSELGYGPNGTQRIPPNSTLLFEVELVDVMSAQ